MADSTRRSGRATKISNKKLEAEVEEPAAPKKTAKGKKKEETPPEPEEIIRCICGVTSEEEDEEERTMICCDNCAAWQHNECMEIPDKLPEGEQYFCEQCRPDLHKDLLAKISRGEKPWEERARQREEEKSRGKKGRGKKTKKGGRLSVVKTNGAANDASMSQLDEASEAAIEPDTPVSENNKRKLADSTQDAKSPTQAEPPSKTRKVSSPPASKTAANTSRRKSGVPAPTKRDSTTFALQMTLVSNISDIESADRQKAATAIVKMFTDETKKAIKSGSFVLPEGQLVDDFGLSLGLGVEYAIYMNYWGMEPKPSQQYSERLRMVLANVKQNASLRDQLLTGQLSPNAFSKMSSEDMASEELKEQKAEMLKESEKQSMIIQEDGPRIRRTHKGEELVDDQNQIAGASDSAFTAPIRKRPSEIDTAMREPSPEPMSAISPAAIELPEDVESAEAKPPTSVNTHGSPVQSAPPMSANKFDIQNVWSTVKTPGTENQGNRPGPTAPDALSPPVPQKADAEIDQLLKDEDLEDDEPYSPVDHTTLSGGAIWSGKLTMPGVASFKGRAKHCAGADLSSSIPWDALIPSVLGIEGRIDIDRASQYLCGLKWSTTTDVVVVSVTPDDHDDDDKAQFHKLFDYFTQRSRYGVIGKNPNTAVKDTYVVPLEAGASKKPDFVELLDVCTIENPTPERTLLLSFVVKLSNSPSSNQTPRHVDATSIASPIGVSGHPPPMGTHPGFQNAPNQGMPYQSYPPYPQYTSPMQGQNPYSTPPNSHQTNAIQSYPPYIGMEAARFALGDLVNCKAVAQLVREAPKSGVPEFSAVKSILEQNSALGEDYPTLVVMMSEELARRQREGPGPGQGQGKV